jgi:hypothetical protein
VIALVIEKIAPTVSVVMATPLPSERSPAAPCQIAPFRSTTTALTPAAAPRSTPACKMSSSSVIRNSLVTTRLIPAVVESTHSAHGEEPAAAKHGNVPGVGNLDFRVPGPSSMASLSPAVRRPIETAQVRSILGQVIARVGADLALVREKRAVIDMRSPM